jgi:hypothetical protein
VCLGMNCFINSEPFQNLKFDVALQDRGLLVRAPICTILLLLGVQKNVLQFTLLSGDIQLTS